MTSGAEEGPPGRPPRADAPPLFLSEIPARYARVPSLDGLRAASILLVMFSHFVAANLFPGGFGVLVFFVISGFLIARLMFAEVKASATLNLANFFLRRLLRLYPVIVVYTLAVLLLFRIRGEAIDWWQPASALFYFANYLYAHMGAQGLPADAMPFEIFWSLSVEEHFYLLFPPAFILLRGIPKSIGALMAIIIALCVAARLTVAFFDPGLLETRWFYYTELRLDSIAFGVLLAALCEIPQAEPLVRRMEHPLIAGGALVAMLACFAIRDPWFRETLRYSIQGVAVMILLAAVLFSPRYRAVQCVLNWAPLQWIGVLSYSLYVWHFLVQPLLGPPSAPGDPGHILALFALSFALAAISHYCLERPLLRLRHRFGSRTA